MNSRLERYNELEEENNVPSRVEKNQKLYHELNSSELLNVKSWNNVKVIDESPRAINIEKIKKYILSLNEDAPRRKVSLPEENHTQNIEESKKEEDKIYDINSVLEKARQKREQNYEENRYRKLRDTQYDILSKIKMYDENEKPNYEADFNTDERTLIDLINTVKVKKDDLLSDLVSDNENTIVTLGIEDEAKNMDIKSAIENQKVKEEEINIGTPEENKEDIKNNIDKSFYTNSLSFSKSDFEGFEELEKKVKKNNLIVKIVVFFLILLGLATIFIVLKFGFNLELF